MFQRELRLPPPGTETFLLLGARQTGKTTLLRRAYPEGFWLDLLHADVYRRYLQHPELLREELGALPPGTGPRRGLQVVVDEVQKVPELLDEIHGLHERGFRFALCGSSARKLRGGRANLLGGRALSYPFFGLVSRELGSDFDLVRLLNHGFLPRIYESERPRRLLESYVSTYLREEIAAEGLVRNLPSFAEFLNVAALSDAEIVNATSIGRDCGVSSHTVKAYFQILVDTLLGRWVPAYRRRPKRRTVAAPKFYFTEVGTVNVLAKRGPLEPGSAAFGKAFETWVCHELAACLAYHEHTRELSYWRLTTGSEVDFVVGDMHVAIEAKATARVTSDHLKGLRAVAHDYPEVSRRLVVCLEPRRRRTEDGIDILPVRAFTEALWQGELLGPAGS